MNPSRTNRDQSVPPSLLFLNPSSSSGLTFSLGGNISTGPSLIPISLASPTDENEGDVDTFLGEAGSANFDFGIGSGERVMVEAGGVSSVPMMPVAQTNAAAPPFLSGVMPTSVPPPAPSPPTGAAKTQLNRRYVLPPELASPTPVSQTSLPAASCSSSSSSPPPQFTPLSPPMNNNDVQGFQHPTDQQMQPPPLLPYQRPVYHPVEAYWFYCVLVDGLAVWRPFSRHDSYHLEEAQRHLEQKQHQHRHQAQSSSFLTSGSSSGEEVQAEEPVPVEGGRYDVFVSQRERRSIYWDEAPAEVRRATWFYRPENESRYIPYTEQLASLLEAQYKSVLESGQWHRQFELPAEDGSRTNDIFVFHSLQSMVQYRDLSAGPIDHSALSPGNVYPTLVPHPMRPRVVRRGLDDFVDQLEDGEWQTIDHVIFVVHGIGSACDLRGRSLVECVGDMRRVARDLMRSHFPNHRGGRVDFLPVRWHCGLHSEATGIDHNLRRITLRSIPKLRHYINDTLLDTLFYTSPKYCQTIVDTVAGEMSRLKNLFMTRHPDYQGGFSIAGHSLGSVISFDLLAHQSSTAASQPINDEVATVPLADNLDQLLERLQLTEISDKLTNEQLDLSSLVLLDECDLKDLGIPLGPRKKLINYIRSTQHGHQVSSEGPATTVLDPLLRRANSQSINFVVGQSGIGHPLVLYPQLDFPVTCMFALGSPIAMLLTTRGIEHLPEDYRLPTCRNFFNIFHPFDPVAYRIETMINPTLQARPVLIPHHKGRKRMHLELKENLARVGADIKSRIVQSLRVTWQTLSDFAQAHRTGPTSGHSELASGQDGDLQRLSEEDEDVARVLSRLDSQPGERDDTSSTMTEDDIPIGQLNQGRRIDYVLQEAPLESFNDYLFALSSHACYWESEDTILLILRETYAPMSVCPVMPGQSMPPVAWLPAPPHQQTQQVLSYPQTSVSVPTPTPQFPPSSDTRFNHSRSAAPFAPIAGATIAPPPLLPPPMFPQPSTTAAVSSVPASIFAPTYSGTVDSPSAAFAPMSSVMTDALAPDNGASVATPYFQPFSGPDVHADDDSTIAWVTVSGSSDIPASFNSAPVAPTTLPGTNNTYASFGDATVAPPPFYPTPIAGTSATASTSSSVAPPPFYSATIPNVSNVSTTVAPPPFYPTPTAGVSSVFHPDSSSTSVPSLRPNLQTPATVASQSAPVMGPRRTSLTNHGPIVPLLPGASSPLVPQHGRLFNKPRK